MGEFLMVENAVVRAALAEHDSPSFDIDEATEPVRNKFSHFRWQHLLTGT
jgi:hypothetical protein